MAMLVGIVGFVALSSLNTARANNEFTNAFSELTHLETSLSTQILQLVNTTKVDEFNQARVAIETTRQDFDLLHEKIEVVIHGGRVFAAEEDHDKDINEFTKLYNGIIAAHQKKIALNKEFNERVNREKQLRRSIREPLFALNNLKLTENILRLFIFSYTFDRINYGFVKVSFTWTKDLKLFSRRTNKWA